MREENGWVYDPEEQQELLKAFFDALAEKQSLVFFYGMHGNPMDDASDRVLLGVGRITNIEAQQYFGGVDSGGQRYPIWWRKITHAGDTEGVRLPYKEYLDADPSGIAARRIACPIPDGARSEFSYVAEHVRDDTAIAVLERLDHSLAQVERDGLVKGGWKKARVWIQTTLAELWRERGAFPGIPALLAHLGMTNGDTAYRTIFRPLERAGKDPRFELFAYLEGAKRPQKKKLQQEFSRASVEWQDKRPTTRELLRLLIRFDLTKQQLTRTAVVASRAIAGIAASDQELIDNPYLLVEYDLGERESESIGFETIDHGMLLDKNRLPLLAEPPIGRNDRRRIRALLVRVLRKAEADGDTFLPLEEALLRATAELPEKRRIDGDSERFLDEPDWYAPLVCSLDEEGSPPLVALTRTREMETFVADVLGELAGTQYGPSCVDWSMHLVAALEDADPLSEEIEQRARNEKIDVLERAFRSRLSVVTGRAGTGKTTVVRALLDGIEQVEGRHSTLLLAPTGKARARLQAKAKRETRTIHSFLARNKWLHSGTFSLKWEGGNHDGARTVVIDEVSMLPIDLLAVALKALKRDHISRLILVGDPNQLPPIGPGRPLSDIIGWLDEPGRRHALGQLRERARAKDVESDALQLSDLFTAEPPNASDDDILVRLANDELAGDLEVHYWTDTDELEQKMLRRLEQYIAAAPGEKEHDAFNRSLKSADSSPAPDRWQILSPIRGEGFGTELLNRLIQQRFHGGLLRMRGAKPVGAQQIVWLDKVMQISNQRRENASGNDAYVANGDVGIVVKHWAKKKVIRVAFTGQTEEIAFFGRSDVEENLELAYATTVHKAQGSDFDTVFLVLPRTARNLSRELLYTALTRFQSKLVLFLEGDDVATLERFARPEFSNTARRNTNLFQFAGRPELDGVPYSTRLIHRSKSGKWVRSKSELVVARALDDLGVVYEYEQRLADTKHPKSGYLPDFTIFYRGEVYYWEHLGMLDQTTYKLRWEKKRAWYENNGYGDRLIISKDGAGGSLDEQEIARIAREQILER